MFEIESDGDTQALANHGLAACQARAVAPVVDGAQSAALEHGVGGLDHPRAFDTARRADQGSRLVRQRTAASRESLREGPSIVVACSLPLGIGDPRTRRARAGSSHNRAMGGAAGPGAVELSLVAPALEQAACQESGGCAPTRASRRRHCGNIHTPVSAPAVDVQPTRARRATLGAEVTQFGSPGGAECQAVRRRCAIARM